VFGRPLRIRGGSGTEPDDVGPVTRGSEGPYEVFVHGSWLCCLLKHVTFCPDLVCSSDSDGETRAAAPPKSLRLAAWDRAARHAPPSHSDFDFFWRGRSRCQATRVGPDWLAGFPSAPSFPAFFSASLHRCVVRWHLLPPPRSDRSDLSSRHNRIV
jgi:hypothetical protein